MQYAKDSFYMALRERLLALNPSRTVTISGAVRPAVVVVENELPSVAMQLPDAFYLEWGTAISVEQHAAERMLMKMECVVSYYTMGRCDSQIDRGRALGELDRELLSICQPARTSKQDFTQTPSMNMGTEVFWSEPELREWKRHADRDARQPTAGLSVEVGRAVKINVYFFPEVILL